MVAEGVLDNVDAICIHVWSELSSGKVSLEPVPVLLRDRFKVTVKGRGSHGAMPIWAEMLLWLHRL